MFFMASNVVKCRCHCVLDKDPSVWMQRDGNVVVSRDRARCFNMQLI